VIPDDRASRPLTPGEQAAIADLERRLLLDSPVPVRDHAPGTRPVRVRPARSCRSAPPAESALPIVALLTTACLLVAVLSVAGGGLLGVAAVFMSVAGTALLWPLLPARLGGPVRPHRTRDRRPTGR
jgi:hypothetical protein